MRSTIEQVPDEQSRTVMRIAAAFARDGKKPDSAVTLLTPIALTRANFDKTKRVGEM
jgi:ribose transport system substrate-binding protein/inositol transport system substrate-binding protein